MAPLWSITRGASMVLKKIRLPLRTLPKTGVRALGTKIPTQGHIVTSPFSATELPTGNLNNTVFQKVGQWGSKIAVECSQTGRNYTYTQLLELMAKWAGFLTSLGLRKGDVIAIYMPNCVEYPIVLLGAISIGVIVTPVNNNYTADEVELQLRDSQASLLVGYPSLEANISTALAKHERPLHLVMAGPSMIPEAFNLHDLLKDPTIPYADPVEVTGKDLAFMPYSSGTTGRPKGVMVSHGAFSSNLPMFFHPAVYDDIDVTDDMQRAYMAMLPFYHLYGMLITMVGFHAGVKLVTLPGFEPESFINILKKNRIEELHLVPPLLNFLVKYPGATPDILSSVKRVIIGAAPVSPTEAKTFKDKFGEHIFFQEAYGMTEVLVTNKMPLADERIGTTGQLLSNVTSKIIDASTGDDLLPTQTGEICIKTPGMMSGYFQNEAATSSIVDDDGWLHTGDVGFFDEDGFLKIVDRTKELIKVKGLQVSPSELEDVIRNHPGVEDVGVVGIPHDRQGEAPRAYIISNSQLSDTDIHRFIEKKVAPHKKLVGGVTFVKELPKTATGKLLRRELKRMALG